MLKRTGLVLIPTLFCMGLIGCGGGDNGGNSIGSAENNRSLESMTTVDSSANPNVSAPVANAPAASEPASAATRMIGVPEAHAEAPAVVGTTCQNGDPNHICLSLKYVAYQDSKGTPTVNQSEALADLEAINKVWGQCNIGFQISNYSAINANDHGLKYNTANSSELDDIRKALSDDTSLLVVTTGTWDRGGSLGNTGANAWTTMPGESVYGVVLEKTVATFGNIIAHELGHYVGLDHASDKSNLMNPVIYDESNKLTPDQCETARHTVGTFWQKMTT